MNESQIELMLRSHPHTARHFKGVYARDEFPAAPLVPGGIYVCNLSRRNEVGTHWVLIYISPENVILYFDPEGQPAFLPEFLSVFNKYAYYVYNSVRIQSVRSRACGLFCVYFAIQLVRGHSIVAARAIFEHHTEYQRNERILAT